MEFEEFVLIARNLFAKRNDLGDQSLRNLFNLLDSDNNGFICDQELVR